MLRRPKPQTRLHRSVDDPSAFEEFYRAHAEAILVFLSRHTLDPHLALDLTSETFAKVFAARGRFRGSTEEEAAAWLFRIARNELYQYGRRGKVARKATQRPGLTVPTLSEDDLETVERLASMEPLRQAVRTHFADLPDAQRDAVQLRVIEEMPYPDVAVRLGITEATARARVSRGLRDLRERLTPRPGELSWMTD